MTDLFKKVEIFYNVMFFDYKIHCKSEQVPLKVISKWDTSTKEKWQPINLIKLDT